MAENQVTVVDKGKSKQGHLSNALIEINGQRFQVFSRVVDYAGDGKQIFEQFIEAAWHHNQSNRVEITAKTLKGLVGVIQRHEYKLVRYTRMW